jgi:transposase InsO family protein
MCKYLQVSKSGYYKYKKSKQDRNIYLYEIIKEIQEKVKYRYGYRRISIELKNARKMIVNHKRVLRIMSKYGLLSKIRRKYIYMKSIIDGEKSYEYQNLYKRIFKAESIDEKWTTDISCILTPQGKLYLSVIRDIYDGFVVAYKYSTYQTINLVINTIKEALKYVKNNKTILHSDRGGQYRSAVYYNCIKEHGITGSMSAGATPLDNAPAESFFSAFKSECIYLEKPKTIQEAKEMTDEYIEFYNYQRIQLKHEATPYQVRQKIAMFA